MNLSSQDIFAASKQNRADAVEETKLAERKKGSTPFRPSAMRLFPEEDASSGKTSSLKPRPKPFKHTVVAKKREK